MGGVPKKENLPSDGALPGKEAKTMLTKRRGADMVEWVVGIVIVLGVLTTSVYALFSTLGDKFTAMDASLH
jgi:hypothetical protein